MVIETLASNFTDARADQAPATIEEQRRRQRPLAEGRARLQPVVHKDVAQLQALAREEAVDRRGQVTLGLLTQITNVFDQVRSSFQYLVNSWTTIVELLSIYKRLRTFEAALGHEPLPSIDREYLAKGEGA
jgi:hypothetical protein